jgi:hypothetical protein
METNNFTQEQQARFKEIAATILNQIKYGDKFALTAYGAKDFQSLPESKEFQGGIKFSVSGMFHKGNVLVQLRWVDDYTISFTNNEGKEVKKYEGIYCDQLVEILDYVEKGDNEMEILNEDHIYPTAESKYQEHIITLASEIAKLKSNIKKHKNKNGGKIDWSSTGELVALIDVMKSANKFLK